MKIKIQRAFSQKVQAKQYEPIESFCGAEVEFDYEVGTNEKEDASRLLDKFCRQEVEYTLGAELAKRKQVDKQKSVDQGRDSAEQDTESLLNNEE